MGDIEAFALPAVDAAPDAEAGIVLLGLDTDRLLAGLGLAAQPEAGTWTTRAEVQADPASATALVTLAVDRVRHQDPDVLATVVRRGVARWREVRAALRSAGIDTVVRGALRDVWADASGRVARAIEGVAAAEHVYLATCVVRRTDVDHAAGIDQ